MVNITSASKYASLLCLIFHIGSVLLANTALGGSPTIEVSEKSAERDPGVLSSEASDSPNRASEDAQGAIQKEKHPVCPPPINHTVKGHPFVQSVSNCTCDCTEDGTQLGWYANGTPCFALGMGYNQEMTPKNGKCYSGVCVLDYIPFGCKGDNYSNLRIPKNESDGYPTVGCAFLCSVLNQADNLFYYQYGYYPVGTPCRHVTKPGNYTDDPSNRWTGTEYETKTCREVGNATLCRDDGDVPLC